MRKRVDSRLKRMETRIYSAHERDREDARRMIRMVAEATVSLIPGYGLITEADADPQTWREVRRTRAQAEGDWEEAERLRHPAPPGGQPERAARSSALQARAIANARRRVARQTGKRLRDVLPNWRKAFR